MPVLRTHRPKRRPPACVPCQCSRQTLYSCTQDTATARPAAASRAAARCGSARARACTSASVPSVSPPFSRRSSNTQAPIPNEGPNHNPQRSRGPRLGLGPLDFICYLSFDLMSLFVLVLLLSDHGAHGVTENTVPLRASARRPGRPASAGPVRLRHNHNLAIRLGPLLRATGRGLGRWVSGPSVRCLRAPAEGAALTTAGLLRTDIPVPCGSRRTAHRPRQGQEPTCRAPGPRANQHTAGRRSPSLQACWPCVGAAHGYPATASPVTWRARRAPERLTVVSAKTRAASSARDNPRPPLREGIDLPLGAACGRPSAVRGFSKPPNGAGRAPMSQP